MSNRNRGDSNNRNNGNTNRGDYGSFDRPVGSVPNGMREPIVDRDSNLVVDNGMSTNRAPVESEYGYYRGENHNGKFSKDNPYYEQLLLAENEQDIDALFERAIEWESDYSNLEEQRAYNKSVLDEQRQYDSPIEQLKRARQAGINPDIAGGSAGGSSNGSSAQMQLPQMADQAGQTKYSNKYDNAEMIMNGINTAMNVISTVTNFGVGLSNMIGQMSLLPSQVSLSESQAYVAEKTRDTAVAQAGENLSTTRLSNAAQLIQNSKDTLGLLNTLSDAGLTVDSTDEDYANSFDIMGITDDNMRSMLLKGHRKYLSDPKMQAAYQKNIKEMRENQAYNATFTPDMLSSILTGQAKLEIAQNKFNLAHTEFQNNLVDLMNQNNIAESQVGVLQDSLEVQKIQLESTKIELKDSVDKLMESVNFIDKQKQHYKDSISRIYQKAQDNGRDLTDLEQAEVKSYQATLAYLETQTIAEKQAVYRSVQQMFAQRAFMEQNQKDNGDLKRGTGKRNRQNEAIENIFQDWYDNKMSNEQLGQQIYSNIITGINTASQVANSVSNFLPQN